MVSLTHTKRLKIHVDVLPATPGSGVYLVHDANVRMLFRHLDPPVPALAVDGAEREGMEGFDVLPVGEGDERIGRLGVCAKEGGRSA